MAPACLSQASKMAISWHVQEAQLSKRGDCLQPHCTAVCSPRTSVPRKGSSRSHLEGLRVKASLLRRCPRQCQSPLWGTLSCNPCLLSHRDTSSGPCWRSLKHPEWGQGLFPGTEDSRGCRGVLCPSRTPNCLGYWDGQGQVVAGHP